MGVNAQEQGDPHKLARGFVDEHGLTYPVLMDVTDAMTQAYRIQAFPSIAILDRKGDLRYLESGFDEGTVVSTVERLLGE